MIDLMLEKNRRILVIDDNVVIHNDFRKILCDNVSEADLNAAETEIFGEESSSTQTVNFQIDSTTQGKEGLSLVLKAIEKGQPYAMAFVDVRMPTGWGGVETVSRIWKECPDLEVVICTAYSDYSWDELTEKLGHTDKLLILKKPFDNVEVRQLAYALTSKWNLARKIARKMDELKRKVKSKTYELEEQKRSLEKTVKQLQ